MPNHIANTLCVCEECKALRGPGGEAPSHTVTGGKSKLTAHLQFHAASDRLAPPTPENNNREKASRSYGGCKIFNFLQVLYDRNLKGLNGIENG